MAAVVLANLPHWALPTEKVAVPIPGDRTIFRRKAMVMQQEGYSMHTRQER
jgi:hypothetical protein